MAGGFAVNVVAVVDDNGKEIIYILMCSKYYFNV